MSQPGPALLHTVIESLFAIGIGIWIIVVCRRFFARPDLYIARWQPWSPQKPWAWKLVRSCVCFCIWAGNMMLLAGATSAVNLAPGVRLLFGAAGASVILTFLEVPKKAFSIESLSRLKGRG